MPYIPTTDRTKYEEGIHTAVNSIKNENMIECARLFGHFTSLLLRRTIFGSQAIHHGFSEFGDDSREESVLPIAIALANLVPKEVSIRQGELNYVISKVMWGLEGDYPGLKQAKYALRSYLKGALWFVLRKLEDLDNWHHSTILYGLLTDVIDENYFRKTGIYEQAKRFENGDLWPRKPLAAIRIVPGQDGDH